MEEEIFVVTLSGILSDLCGIDLDFIELQSEALNNMVWKYKYMRLYRKQLMLQIIIK